MATKNCICAIKGVPNVYITPLKHNGLQISTSVYIYYFFDNRKNYWKNIKEEIRNGKY